MTMYERLQKAAKAKKISLPDIGRQIGIGERSLYNWKTSKPSSETVSKVAEVLGVSYEWLLTGHSILAKDIFLADGDIHFNLPEPEQFLTDDEIEVIDCYHNAPPEIQSAVRRILEPYKEDTASAVV